SDTFPLRPAQPFWLSCLLHLAKAGVCPDGRLLLICWSWRTLKMAASYTRRPALILHRRYTAPR
ncbi:MAG: hypothetical protein WAK85_20840, partial [Xanthobacteraceae bacterium]